jgi:hypothetical protein
MMQQTPSMSRSLISASYIIISICLNFIRMSSLININNYWVITNNEIQGKFFKI